MENKTLLHSGLEVELDIGLSGIYFNSLNDRHFKLLLNALDGEQLTSELSAADIILPQVKECHDKRILLSRPAAARVFSRDGIKHTKSFFGTCSICKNRYYTSYKSEFVEVEGKKNELRQFYKTTSDSFQLSIRSIFEVELLLDLHYQGNYIFVTEFFDILPVSVLVQKSCFKDFTNVYNLRRQTNVHYNTFIRCFFMFGIARRLPGKKKWIKLHYRIICLLVLGFFII